MVTIGGPLSSTVDQLEGLLRAGMTVARFDTTAGSRTVEEHWTTLKNLRVAQKRTKRLCAVYVALGGDVYAVTRRDDTVRVAFEEGQTVRLVHGEPIFETTDVLPLGADDRDLDFLSAFAEGDSVHVHPFLRAGETPTDFEVVSVNPREVICRCLKSVEMHETVRRLAVSFARPGRFAVNAGDRSTIERFAAPARVDFISFGQVPDAGTLRRLREELREAGLPHVGIIAQIDNLSALRDLPATMKEADVVLLSRGELGTAVAPEKMFAVQKHVLRMCEKIGKPCVVTRLMDSMISAPRPTRAEATDIANIVLDGADALLLGLETMEGLFPLSCLETTLAIAREADSVYDYESRYRRQMQQINVKLAKATDSVPWGEKGEAEKLGERRRPAALAARLEHFEPNVNLRKEALAAAAVQTAFQVDASLIVVFSHTGETTRLVAKYHPQCPVLSLSIPVVHGGTVKWTVEGDAEARQQLVYRGVVPALSAPSDVNEDETAPVVRQPGATRTDVEALTKATALGLIRPGELAVFCQLIAGLSTVKVVEFAGMSRPISQTFSPPDSRCSSPAMGMREVPSNHRMAHIGTMVDLEGAGARAAEERPVGDGLAQPPRRSGKAPRRGSSNLSISSTKSGK